MPTNKMEQQLDGHETGLELSLTNYMTLIICNNQTLSVGLHQHEGRKHPSYHQPGLGARLSSDTMYMCNTNDVGCGV